MCFYIIFFYNHLFFKYKNKKNRGHSAEQPPFLNQIKTPFTTL